MILDVIGNVIRTTKTCTALPSISWRSSWVQASLREAGTSLESILEINPEYARYLTVHPGELTIVEVGVIARKLPTDVARRMLDRLMGAFAL